MIRGRKASGENSRTSGAASAAVSEHAFERRVIESADHIIVTTEKTLDQFLAKYPSVPSSKYSVIPNGFDAADFAVATGGDRLLDESHFNVTLTGNVEAMFDAVPFLTAVRDLVEEDEGMRAALRINFVGTKRGKYDNFIQQNSTRRQCPLHRLRSPSDEPPLPRRERRPVPLPDSRV